MKCLGKYVCVLVILALCACMLAFLHYFTEADNAFAYVSWQSARIVMADGTSVSFETEASDGVPSLPEGACFAFSAVLEEQLPDGYLLFETSGAELSLYLDGEEIFRSSSVPLEGTNWLSQAHVVLPDGVIGRELVMTYRPLEGFMSIFPPLVRMTSQDLAEADIMAYANLHGFSADALGFAFLIICGLFFVGMTNGKTDWSLPVLALATIVLMVSRLAAGCGYYFLPASLYEPLIWRGFPVLTPFLVLIYLLMNQRRSFFTYLGYAAALSAATLLLGYGASGIYGGSLFANINAMAEELFFYGVYDGVLYWLTAWLVIVCACIACYGWLRVITDMRIETHTLALRNQLFMDSYHAMERSVRETAAMRHELKNHMLSLSLLYQKNDMQALGDMLSKLDKQRAALGQTQFCGHFALNALLQNTAARAAEQETRFEVDASVPGELSIAEEDLCSLLMNLLDNALEASHAVADISDRRISFYAEAKQGFLVVRCQNTYCGTVKRDARGLLLTTKPDAAAHGFGLKQMQTIAEKYHSMLDIEQTEDTFIVRTALRLP